MSLKNGFVALTVLALSRSSVAKPVAGGWESNEYQLIPACPVMPIECTAVITSYVTITPTVTATVIGTETQGGQTAIVSSSEGQLSLAPSSISGVASSAHNSVAPTYSHGHHHHTSAIGSGILIYISEGSSVIEPTGPTSSAGSESVLTNAVSMQSSSPASMEHHHHHNNSMVTFPESAATSAAAGTHMTTPSPLTFIEPITTGSILTSSYLQCDHDNCLREFLRHSAVTPFCATYTTELNTATTGLPTYVSQCQANPSRIFSACACISSIAGNSVATATSSSIVISPASSNSLMIMTSANSPSNAPGTTAVSSHSRHGHHSHSHPNSQAASASGIVATNPTTPISPSTLATMTLPTQPTIPVSVATETNPICPLATVLFETTTVTTTFIQTVTSIYDATNSYPAMSTSSVTSLSVTVGPNGMTTPCDENGMPIKTSSMMVESIGIGEEMAMSTTAQTGGYAHGGHGHGGGNGGWKWRV